MGFGEHAASRWAPLRLRVPACILAPGPAGVRPGPEEGPVRGPRSRGGRDGGNGVCGSPEEGHRKPRPAGNIAVSLSAPCLGPRRETRFHFLLGDRVARVASVDSHVTAALQDLVLWSSLTFLPHAACPRLPPGPRGEGRGRPIVSVSDRDHDENTGVISPSETQLWGHGGQRDLTPPALSSLRGAASGRQRLGPGRLAMAQKFGRCLRGDSAEACRPNPPPSVAPDPLPRQGGLPSPIRSPVSSAVHSGDDAVRARGHPFVTQQVSWKGRVPPVEHSTGACVPTSRRASCQPRSASPAPCFGPAWAPGRARPCQRGPGGWTSQPTARGESQW